MNALIKIFFSIFLLLTTFPYWNNSEICDNSIDDDRDGKIDLNDEECFCTPLETVSLIPNASFEGQDCCPKSHSSMHCASGWVQASEATTDYFHTCDWVSSLNVPQPLPHGNGYVGFIDGVVNGDFNPDWKEYVGTCLTDTLYADSIYRLQFYAGFLSKETSPDMDIAIFGTADCGNLPFGVGDPTFGCPSNSSDWFRLGSVNIYGENEWKQFSFTLKSKLDITAVAIGPDCYHRTSDRNPYHFLDNLVLAKESSFEIDIKDNGFPCANDFSLRIAAQEGFDYQWYKNGVAVVGATNSILYALDGRGEYQVRITNENGCQISTPYLYRPPFQSRQIAETICVGNSYSFGGQELFVAGNYIDTFKSINNCDSIVRLNLSLSDAKEVRINIKIFPSENYFIGKAKFKIPGAYIQTIPSKVGCDSTVFLDLKHYQVYVPNTFSPNDDGKNDAFSIYGANDLKRVILLEIFDRWGNLVYQGQELERGKGWNGKIDGKTAQTGVYIYQAVLLMNDEKERKINGTFSLLL